MPNTTRTGDQFGRFQDYQPRAMLWNHSRKVLIRG